MASAAVLTIGATLGTLAPLLGTVGSPIGHVADLILSAGWTWAALAFCVGLARKSRMESVILAPASLITAVIAYYVTKLGQGEFRTLDLNNPSATTTQIEWSAFLSKTVVWCIAACLLGSLLGLAGNLARNHGLRGLPFRVLVPLVAVVDTTQRLNFDAPLEGTVATTTWSVIRFIAVAVILALVGHTVITWRSRPSAGQARR
ncbi:hypothetical protein OG762_20065 [Streptomyces sp. NBC_01136]|uniref:hypothetical protein n=1 Tax=unclassified Streptomyces TaxID=2593676 RepID=UPI00324747BB|nr:hypothetical protein OG762_20065 [Streptomyces sp. NBC_01136]